MIRLTKIYSREKPLFYLSMWNDSDRMGWHDFLGHEVRHNLFYFPGPGMKSSVWYEQTELDVINAILKKKLLDSADPMLLRLTERLESEWEKIYPFVSGEQALKTIEEFEAYYAGLVAWWSAMNTAFVVPDMEEIDAKTRAYVLSFREKSEKLTEKMSERLVAFWKEEFPQYADLAYVLTPGEAARLAKGTLAAKELEAIRARLHGYGMLNEKVYALDALAAAMQHEGVSMDQVTDAQEMQEIRGKVAFIGHARGIVRLVRTFVDLEHFENGEVLVTEMTNPNYLSAIKKACAIITDEGGITCHAAIVARELSKPCIIGTKVATKWLRDGDEVEVDAEKGIVRILNRA